MKNIIIVVLILLILISGLFSWDPAYQLISKYFNGGVDPYKIHTDSILVAKKDIETLKRKDLEIVAQMNRDSIKRHQEKEASLRVIRQLKKKASDINFTVTTSAELDSIRKFIWRSSDVVWDDTMYTIPIDQARDALEAKAREPFKDSTINALEYRVWNLEGDLIIQEAAFKKRIVGFTGITDKKDVQIRNLEAINKKQSDEHKAQKLKGILKGVAGMVIGFGIGKASN